jgi:hypothetical protein
MDGQTKIYALAPAAKGLPGLVTKLALWEDINESTAYWLFECALLQNFSLTMDQDSKEVMEWSVDFGADGKFWRPGQAGTKPSQGLPSDAPNPTVFPTS